MTQVHQRREDITIPSRGVMPEILRPTVATRERIREALNTSPWIWPPDDDSRVTAARALVPTGAPQPRPGETILVTATADLGGLWHFAVGASSQVASPLPSATIGEQALRAWDDARTAVDRALPVRMGTAGAGEERLRASALFSLPLRPGAVATPASTIDGRSFGLSFALAQASYILSIPLPTDLAASADVDAHGAVRGVDGLDGKIAAIRAAAPRVRRVLVAAEDIASARQLGGAALEFMAATSVDEALGIAFGTGLAERVVLAASTRKDAAAEELLHTALKPRTTFVNWEPIAAAADLALRVWPDLTACTRYSLELTRAIAHRHNGVVRSVGMPPPGWIEPRPRPTRVRVAAHLVQQCADCGEPTAAETLALAEPLLPERLSNAFETQAMLAGAVARLWAVTGREGEALARQSDLARYFGALGENAEWSFPLSEWFRLSGVCGSPAAFEAATAFWASHGTAAPQMGDHYVRLARARAMVLLGRRPSEDDWGDWLALATNRQVASHLRWSAARWCLRAGLATKDERAAHLLDTLRTASTQPTAEGREASIFHTLVLADRARHARDEASEQAALNALHAHEPALMNHLSAAKATTSVPTLDLYPY